MGLFLFRFWPVLIPLILYWVWWLHVGRQAVKAGNAKPSFRDGPWYWAVLATLFTGVLCFIAMGLALPDKKGSYTPPHLENGVMVPGRVE